MVGCPLVALTASRPKHVSCFWVPWGMFCCHLTEPVEEEERVWCQIQQHGSVQAGDLNPTPHLMSLFLEALGRAREIKC